MNAGPATRWRALRRELAIGLTLFGVYVVVELLGGPARRQAADQHALAIARIEQRLGIDVEAAMNHWITQHSLLTTLANYEYAFSYLLAAALLLTWAALRRPPAYPFARNSFIALNLVGITCFLLYPLTPPRMVPELGMVDTVRAARVWGSWGTPMIDQANQLAAMPSLHVAWTLWVTVMLARLAAARWLQLVSAAYVVLTTLVIMATANHFVLDAVGGAVAVWLGVAMTRRWDRRPPPVPGQPVPSADAFFWYVESDTTLQHVGGLGLFAPSRDNGPAISEVRRRVQRSLGDIPAFRRRLEPGSRWRRPRWVSVPAIDLDWHVREHDLTTATGEPGGMSALHAYVARLAATRLPIDRPLWLVVIVRGVSVDQSAMVLLAHHTIADGLGVIASALRFFDPQIALPRGTGPPASGPLRRAASAALGIAELATDGLPKAALSQTTSPTRQFAAASMDLDLVRNVARRHGCRVTDVLLSAVAGALCRRQRSLAARIGSQLRVAVPLPVADTTAVTGNVTAGVIMSLPLEPMPEARRLALIAARSSRLRTPSRALAARLVVARGLAWAPAPAARWFARTVYGHRFFHAIVSNMTGPAQPLLLAGARLTDVVPILPLAPGAPLAVGALGWNGRYGVGVITDPDIVSANQLCAELVNVVAELAEATPHIVSGGLQVSTRRSRAR